MQPDVETARLLARLDAAFASVEKPVPLADRSLGHWPEEVDHFNSADWDAVTWPQFADGMEGWIIASPEALHWLIPSILKMVLVRREDEAVDNAGEELRFRLVSADTGASLSRSLTDAQKRAVIDVYQLLDRTHWSPSRSTSAGELAAFWGLASPPAGLSTDARQT